MNEQNNIPTRCSEVVGEALDALTAEVERLKAENAKLRELVKELVGCFENWIEKYPPSEWSQLGQSWQLIEETVARAREGGAK